MKVTGLRLFLLSVLALSPLRVSAATVAVFPLLDLSRDANGVNFTLTEALRQKAAEYGFEVLPDNDVMAFMVRHRIRKLGVLNSYEIMNLRRELHADYALLGTVCQLDRKPRAKVSLSLQLIRTRDEEIVWTAMKDLHEKDLISLLGITEPDSLNDLYREYFETLLDAIPTDDASDGGAAAKIGLLSVQLHPNYVKPGQRVGFTARTYSTAPESAPPTVYLRVGDRKIPLEQDGDLYFLRASWQAQEVSGDYNVRLVAEFASGREQVLDVGRYTVDTVPPGVRVRLGGKVVNGVLTFNRDLVIMPRMTVPELLSRWLITVFDAKDTTMLTFGGAGKLPGRVYWDGTLSEVETAPDGLYRIRVEVWDRAGNSSMDEQEAMLRRTRPIFDVAVTRNEKGLTLALANAIEYPVSFWWVKVYEQNGGLVFTRVGEELPATLEIEYDFAEDNGKLEMFVAAQDVYGNRRVRKFSNLLNLSEGEDEVRYVQEKDWLENF